MSRKLVHIDTQRLVLTRYVEKAPTHAFQFQHNPTPAEVEQVRLTPEMFGSAEPEAA